MVDGRRILDSVSLELTEERVGIIGPNGSGKSTLARLINGLGMPTSGEVSVDGARTSREAKRIRRHVGFMFSDADNQIVMPSVYEDVEFSLRRRKLSRDERASRVTRALDVVGLTGRERQSPHQLSGGEKQMLALASIMVLEPDVIVADEPTTLLDLKNRERFRRMIADVPQQVVMLTHDLDILADFDRVVCLEDGRVVDDSVEGRAPRDVIRAYVDRMTKGE